jgi:hypothetical protein
MNDLKLEWMSEWNAMKIHAMELNDREWNEVA